jgi:hypothetical protein
MQETREETPKIKIITYLRLMKEYNRIKYNANSAFKNNQQSKQHLSIFYRNHLNFTYQ